VTLTKRAELSAPLEAHTVPGRIDLVRVADPRGCAAAAANTTAGKGAMKSV
jgi:hypothetical protein